MTANPTLLTMPLAQNGQKNVIPATQATAGDGLFSQSTGFPAETSLPLGAGGVAPSREDFNGMANLLGGVAFYAQKGWQFQWDATQDYYEGCIVRDTNDGLLYECINDVSAGGVAPSADTVHWQHFGGAGKAIGDIFIHAGSNTPDGALLCNGAEISRTTYAELFSVIGTTYGAGDGSTTFAIPDLSDGRFAEGSTTEGTAKAAGLPNITGGLHSTSSLWIVNMPPGSTESGALSVTFGSVHDFSSTLSTVNWPTDINFDASASNAIYGGANTVQPQSLTVKYYIQYE